MTPFSSSFADSVRSLIAQGDLEVALDRLLAYLKGTASRLENDAIVQASRLRRVERQERQGLMSSADARVERNLVAQVLLYLVDQLLRDLPSAPSPFMGKPVLLEPSVDFNPEKIFGINHLKNIAWLAKGLEVARSVCRIRTPHWLGTGFLISGSRIVTNLHVLRCPEDAGASSAEFNYEEDLEGKLRASIRYQFDPRTYRGDADLDICVVGLVSRDNLPGLEDWGALRWNDGQPAGPGDHVSIIQHPEGGPKQIALSANQVVNVFGHRLQYMTDTLGGSSGSPVFGDDWTVHAVHHGGGNLTMDKQGRRGFANEGILASYVIKALGLA
jgi:V8-like Glu-specific endopeptidase